MALSDQEKQPEHFEPYLEKHAQDESRREAAVCWYEYKKQDRAKLKHHTLLLAKHHPGNSQVLFGNTSAFYEDPAYRTDVANILEEHVEAGTADACTFWMLGRMYERAAAPPRFDSDASRKRFLTYFSLSEDTPLPVTLDAAQADQAAAYYRQAMNSRQEPWERMAAESLVSLLVRLDKADEAAEVCITEIDDTNESDAPDLLVACGRALRKTGQYAGAKRFLEKAKSIDHEGFEDGAGHATTDALTQLGLVALELGDMKEASKMLLASADVQKCCHNTTRGMPLKLANRLFDAGEFAVVFEYCERVLDRFTPNQPTTKALRSRARIALVR